MLYAAYAVKEVFLANNARLSNGFRRCKGCLINFSKNSYLFAGSLAVDKASSTRTGPERISRQLGQAAQHAALLYPLYNSRQSSYCRLYSLILEYKEPIVYYITQRIQLPFFLFISSPLLCSSILKLRNKWTFTETGKYIFSYSHGNLCKLRHCISQWDVHTLYMLCKTS